jgi:hypothetical protein
MHRDLSIAFTLYRLGFKLRVPQMDTVPARCGARGNVGGMTGKEVGMDIGQPTTEEPLLIPEEPLLPQTQPTPDPAPPQREPVKAPA